MTERNIMRNTNGKWRWIIPILLALSFIANILGLLLPFLQIDEAFHANVIYSLPHSVALMWGHKLFLISILILVFSIIFPFFKLCSLVAVWFFPWKSKTRKKYLHGIELLGKWSFMDIFVVILLLALTSKQTNISSTIHSGVYFFIGAISLSMITSEIIMSLARKTYENETPQLHFINKRRWMVGQSIYIGWIVPLLAIASGIALIESLNATFLRISQLFLVSRSYSIHEIGILLWDQKLWVLFVVLVGTLFIIPVLRLAILLFTLLVPMHITNHLRFKKLITVLSRWCMLDVFGLALFLITTEGKDLVKTQIQPGLYVVVFAIALSYGLGAIAIALDKVMIAKAIQQPEET
jgi:paraquat-inducible protein A